MVFIDSQLEGYKFMDWESLPVFTIAVQQLRDEVKNYFDTNLTVFYPNLYTQKYCEIISKLNDLVESLSDEIAERAAQLGRDEKSSIPSKFRHAIKKRRTRKKVKRYTKKVVESLCEERML